MKISQKEIARNVYELNIPADMHKINRREIEINLGYVDNKIPIYFSKMIDSTLSKINELCKIKAGYRLLNVKYESNKKDGLQFGDVFFKLDRIVTSQLKKSTQAAVFVCSIGDKMEKMSADLLENGEPTESFIVDSVASTVVESVTNTLHDFIGQLMLKEEIKITNRYSPGYCNWSVSEQQLLFTLLPKKFCGVTLNQSSLMSPIKSVSGIIGLGKEVKYQEYICDRCGVKDCTHRIKLIEKNKL